MNVQSFLSTVSKAGLARTSNFQVKIQGPWQLGSRRDLQMKIEKATFPGREINTQSLHTYGAPRLIANGATYGTINVTCLLSSDFQEKIYFQRWQALAIGYATNITGYFPGAYDIGYYSDYVGVVTLEQLDSAGNVSYRCTLVEAWPTAVSPLEADWGVDDIHKLQVTFTYRNYIDDPNFAPSIFPLAFNMFGEDLISGAAELLGL